MSKISVAIVGATGLVGETMLEILAGSGVPVEQVYPLASERSVGKRVRFGKGNKKVSLLDDFDFRKTQIALFSAGSTVSETYAPRVVEAGCIVIDNTSRFRYDDDVPLVVPEVNADAIDGFRSRGIIANPNCSTIQMLVALKPIYDAVGIERINVATYQAVSGAGRQSVEQLARQTTTRMSGLELEDDGTRIAFNAVPHIDVFEDNGYTREEMKILWETRKILADPEIMVNATAVRIPVFFGHSEAINVETRDKISAAQARELLQKAPGVEVIDNPAGGLYPTPAVDATQHDSVFVGRIREDHSHPRGLNLWVVSDNIRKGAALNSVQITEILVKDYL